MFTVNSETSNEQMEKVLTFTEVKVTEILEYCCLILPSSFSPGLALPGSVYAV